MKIRLTLAAVCATLICLSLYAQQEALSGALYVTRYKLLVSKVGDCGVGVKSFLDKWEAADSADINMMLGRFNYFQALGARDTIMKMEAATYLGNKPVLALKDSAGRPQNYFRETLYDDALFAQALSWMDRAIATDNTRAELFVAKANALLRFEKGSPDMTLQYLKQVIDKRFTGKTKWNYYGRELAAVDFDALIQDYCFTLYKTGTPACYEAFRQISEKMVKYEPRSVFFLDNLGSYWLVVKKNYGKAKKYYSAALKVDPEDATAKKNLEILGRVSAKKKK